MPRIAPVLAVCLALSLTALAQPYEPTWESLDKRATPQWFVDAKFGIFIHWGVYAVPSWSPITTYSEWYWKHMQNKKGETWKFHVEHYGEDFKYQDFAPQFTAELYDPEQWADLFAQSGAKYVVLTSKHHEGFCLWPSAESWNWNAMDIGPHRDLAGELTEAVRAAGLEMGFYYSFYEWFNPMYLNQVDRYVAEHMLPQMKDLVTRYKPTVFWPDGEWEHKDPTWRSVEFLAWLFNESPVKDTVAVNDRWGKGCRGVHGGFYTTEYGKHTDAEMSAAHPWEECRGMGASFGYNRNETVDDYKSAEALIRLLVDTAGRGGNLLLDIGPTADGRIPVIMQERLVQIGAWLKPNGEAIYGTTGGPFAEAPAWGGCTRKGQTLYLHVFDWPADGVLTAPGLKLDVTKAWFLLDADQRPLETRAGANGLTIAVPVHKPYPAATVIAVEFDGEPAVE